MADLFEAYFGQGQQQQRRGKTDDLVHGVGVSLREFYKGSVRRLGITKDVICAPCKGTGSREPIGADAKCSKCNGSGVEVTVVYQEVMTRQSYAPCSQCQGRGQVIAAADRCLECDGNRVRKEKIVAEVKIRPGMRAGEKIVLPGEANQAPGREAGDIVLVLNERDGDAVEQQFERKGNDLLVRQKISLAEALCGYKRQLQHLDNRWIYIQSPDGAIVKPGDVHSIEGAGMPCTSNPSAWGRLLVQFDVEYPKPSELSMAARSQLLQVLPTEPAPQRRPDAELYVTNADPSVRINDGADDVPAQDGEDAGEGINCAQQ